MTGATIFSVIGLCSGDSAEAVHMRFHGNTEKPVIGLILMALTLRFRSKPNDRFFCVARPCSSAAIPPISDYVKSIKTGILGLDLIAANYCLVDGNHDEQLPTH